MNPTPIKYITTCRICRQEFSAAAFVPLVGDRPDKRIMEFGRALFGHMASKHPEELGAILIVTCFNVTDPILVQTFEPLRRSVHGHTRRRFIDDATITGKLAALGMDSEAIEKLRPLMADMRDCLCEIGNYAPQQAQPSVLVTP